MGRYNGTGLSSNVLTTSSSSFVDDGKWEGLHGRRFGSSEMQLLICKNGAICVYNHKYAGRADVHAHVLMPRMGGLGL